MEKNPVFPIGNEKFNLLVKRAKQKALLKNIAISLCISLLVHWLSYRKLSSFESEK
ncbi:hypothetical protein QWY14_03785 [Planococcus sp. N028]|uniref:Uncharacterized protein n=1 Tax=Planococcus shixiaomingii TaxID=3058393 RepID=A0ABT8MZK9_9BACL|nr:MULTISPECIES: hypothetical protein [unclassified Planococcus (in: firmicutes)]MDN7240893.1 hypothetical protein [Planococcus sp. N028]WKA53135.1 hypothetical protein QWY21_10720 [Planococcus sp. N022]